MNHRHQQFDWDTECGEAVEHPKLTHVHLRLIAYSIGAAGVIVACALAWIGI